MALLGSLRLSFTLGPYLMLGTLSSILAYVLCPWCRWDLCTCLWQVYDVYRVIG